LNVTAPVEPPVIPGAAAPATLVASREAAAAATENRRPVAIAIAMLEEFIAALPS
jgi:hypothetical protein